MKKKKNTKRKICAETHFADELLEYDIEEPCVETAPEESTSNNNSLTQSKTNKCDLASVIPEIYPDAEAPANVTPDTARERLAQRQAKHRNATSSSKPQRRKRLIIALLITLILAMICGGIAIAGYIYVSDISSKISENVDEDLLDVLVTDEEVTLEDPFYMLIIGIDGSEERSESGKYGSTFRSDSIILARVDPQECQVTLISIERDTYVDIEGYGANKINAAAAYGGAALLVETVEEFAGVEISHYVAIDLDGFEAVVDALGGIEVDVPMTIDDDEAGGYVEAGLQTLTGEEALILCRSRHAYDSYGAGDYYRMANQRLVLGAIIEKLLESDIRTMASTISSMADYITTDLTVSEIISLIMQMQDLDTENDIYSAANPTTSSYVDGVWYEICDVEEWQEMMARVDAGLTPYEDEERNANTGGTLDGTVTGTQESNTEDAELSETASAVTSDDETGDDGDTDSDDSTG